MTFIKQAETCADGNGRGQVHFNRTSLDGAPFRFDGPGAPMMREEEFDELTERVNDCKFGVFNTSSPGQRIHGRTYQEVLDGRMADWFQIIAREHKWGEDKEGVPVMYVYIEWAEAYQEIPKSKMHQVTGTTTQLEHGANYAQPNGQNAESQPRPLRPSTQSG
jgi:hypothetical protein